MTRQTLTALLFGLLVGTATADLPQEISAKAAAAREILESYQDDLSEAESERRILHLVYWTPSDRDPADQYRQRLTRVMRHIQKFFADEMQRIGFGPRTIGLQKDDDGLLKIHLVTGARPFADYNKQSGDRVRDECRPVLRKANINPDRETILIFCNMGLWNEKTRVMSHNSPYYAGGTNTNGTAWQLDEPIMDTKNLRDPKPIRDGEYGRISMGKHNSIFIDGVAHELGHALSLPHNKERPDEKAMFGTALMGSGNRTYGDEVRDEGKGSFLTLAHAMRLAAHPQFSGSNREMSRSVSTAFDDLAFDKIENGFRVSGNVTSDVPIYAVIAYTDPEGGGDYNATTQVDVPQKDGAFTIDCKALTRGKSGELRIVTCHANGKTANRRFGFNVRRDGSVDLSTIETRLALGPIVQALNRNSRDESENDIRKMSEDVAAIAKRLVAANRDRQDLPTPTAIAAGISEIALSDTSPSVAKVGWREPTYDRLPEAAMLLSSGGRVFEHGIYAHAPAIHRYQLGSMWKRLTGQSGLADGHRGSVVFVIRCDGKERWRSKTIKQGRAAPFDINVTNVDRIELVVENAADGNGADWGVWLEPTLTR